MKYNQWIHFLKNDSYTTDTRLRIQALMRTIMYVFSGVIMLISIVTFPLIVFPLLVLLIEEHKNITSFQFCLFLAVLYYISVNI